MKVNTMTVEGREVTDMMERRKVDILCVQETRRKGRKRSRTRIIRGRFKLFYHGMDWRKNEAGVILKEEYAECVLEARRVLDRMMSIKLENDSVMMNAIK